MGAYVSSFAPETQSVAQGADRDQSRHRGVGRWGQNLVEGAQDRTVID
jgi:hypothetical protein